MSHALAGRDWLLWVIPAFALLVLLGVETDWGKAVHRLPPTPPTLAAKPVAPTLLPEYQVQGGLAGHPETVGRTLFNPTRRPAPAQVVDAQVKPRLQRGQFVLTGTAVAGDRNVAFLREVAGGRSRLVRQGDQINGLVVADVRADRVKLVLGDEAEEIILKAATAGAPPRPATPAPGQPGQPVPTVVPPSFGPAPSAPAQPPPGNAIEQRRAARAAAAAPPAVVPPPVQPPAAPAAAPGAAAPGTGMPASVDPAWNEVFRRMQTRQQP